MAGRPSRPLRVLAYADSTIFSGAESLFCELVSGLASDPGFEVSVAAPEPNRRLHDALLEATGTSAAIHVPAQQLPLAALFLHDPRRTRAVRKALSGLDVDVILVNLPSAEYGATPLVVRRPAGVPAVGVMHISRTMEELDFRLGGLRTGIARRAIRRLDRVCMLSHTAAAAFRRDWDAPSVATDVFHMPEPKFERQDRDEARKRLGLPAGEVLVATIGRLTARQKGQDVLIQAAPAVVAAHPEVRFVFAGEGRDHEMLEELTRQHGVPDHFTFLGQVEDVQGLLSAVDLIAIPSRFEGLPLVALEALAAGVPGIASSVDGIVDVWPGEWLVWPDDPAALSRSLIGLIEAESGERSKLLESGRKMMKGNVADRAYEDVAVSIRRAAGHG